MTVRPLLDWNWLDAVLFYPRIQQPLVPARVILRMCLVYHTIFDLQEVNESVIRLSWCLVLNIPLFFKVQLVDRVYG